MSLAPAQVDVPTSLVRGECLGLTLYFSIAEAPADPQFGVAVALLLSL